MTEIVLTPERDAEERWIQLTEANYVVVNTPVLRTLARISYCEMLGIDSTETTPVFLDYKARFIAAYRYFDSIYGPRATVTASDHRIGG